MYAARSDSGGFPAAMRISPDRAPRWATDRSAIYFGIAAARTGPDPKTPRPDVRPVAGTPGAMQSAAGVGGTDDDLPTLVIWHGKGDPRLQSQQQVEEGRDKVYSYLSAYRVGDKRFVRLADDEVRDVSLAPRERVALGADRRAYERRDNIDGGQRRDLYVIDVATGARTLAVKSARWNWSASPDGTKALYYDDGEYHVYDLLAHSSRTLTKGAPTSFIDTEDDHNVDRPPVQPLGWTSDNQNVLLFDNWDVWKAPVKGGALVNLTGNGKAEKMRYTRRLVIDPKEKGIDLSRPLYLQTYGEWTKKEGLAVVQPGKTGAQSLLWDDAKFFVSRARDADTWVFTRQTFKEFPDYWVSEKTLAAPRRLTDANPQQKEYAWSSGAQLVNYVSDKGDTLQGALYLPANYEPGKKYPTMVYIYEKLSQGLHQYALPNETRAFNPSVYTSRGYAVLQPDIVYKINDPGMSAVWCVVPAVKAAIATGIVDPDNVGLHGHSWGGYQSSFLATQTGTLFKSIVTGAPLTDMVSMYASVYWNTGTADMAIFESSQGRFKGNVIENTEAYIRNSPAFHADKVQTKMMILHNEHDGAVDFNQGITWFNVLRELDKDVILLQYVGENHGLRVPKNQKDYTIRMQEYFDHYLKGAPAPDWLGERGPAAQDGGAPQEPAEEGTHRLLIRRALRRPRAVPSRGAALVACRACTQIVGFRRRCDASSAGKPSVARSLLPAPDRWRSVPAVNLRTRPLASALGTPPAHLSYFCDGEFPTRRSFPCALPPSSSSAVSSFRSPPPPPGPGSLPSPCTWRRGVQRASRTRFLPHRRNARKSRHRHGLGAHGRGAADLRQLIDEQHESRQYAGKAIWRLATNHIYDGDSRGGAMLLDDLAVEAARFGDPTMELNATFEAAIIWQKLKRNDLAMHNLERVQYLLQSPAIDADVKSRIQRRIVE